jgi:hypothetical protein
LSMATPMHAFLARPRRSIGPALPRRPGG